MKDQALKKKLDADKITSRSYKVFTKVLTRKVTKAGYIANLDNIMHYMKLDNYSKLLDMEANARQDKLEEFLMEHDDKSYSFGNNHVSAVSKFLSMNRAIFWKSPLQALIPRTKKKKAGGLAYTTEDINMMLDVTNSRRTIFIIHYFKACGGRPGSVEDEDGYLTVGDVIPMPDGCASFTIYKGTDEEYVAFLDPEAYLAFQQYLAWRKSRGEEITNASPMFATKYKTARGHLTAGSIGRIMSYVLKNSGVSRVKVNIKKYDKSLIYGFRKRLNAILKLDSDVNSNIAEKLMGHSVTIPLDNVYLPATDPRVIKACFTEYRKVLKEIAVDQTEKLRLENMILKKEDTRVTREKVLEVFDLAEADMGDFTEFMNQKRKDKKYK